LTLDISWIVSFIACGPLVAAGILAVKKAPGTTASSSFLIAVAMIVVAIIASEFTVIDVSQSDLSTAMAMLYVGSLLLSLTFFALVTLVYPLERELRFIPPNMLGVGVALAVVLSIFGGLLARPEFGTPIGTTLTRSTGIIVLVGIVTMIAVATAGTLVSRSKATNYAKRSSDLYLFGLWMVAAIGLIYSTDIIIGHKHDPSIENVITLLLMGSIILVSLLFAFSLGRGRMSIGISPMSEARAAGIKSTYRLPQRHTYLVEDPRSDFPYTLLTDILLGRCFDCEDDESFSCESVGCITCTLPCPCKVCKKYKSRPQGLIITRQFPSDVRKKHALQTTPILWLTTIAGKDNVDPSKLGLLTEYILHFMEDSKNGIVLVDGLEYMISSNDFSRVLKAVEMWTETAMASASRLLLSIDPKAYEKKDLAVLERGREIVSPNTPV
jgi:hypothetical protein